MSKGVTYSSSTKGGAPAYWLRRVIHVCMAALPLLYYRYGGDLAAVFNLVPWQLVLAILLLAVILEAARLFFHVTVFGQRDHEARQPSSFFWGLLSVGVVLILAPPLFAIPIIWSCAFVDPLLGEMRRFAWRKWLVILVGWLVLLLIWLFGNAMLGTPWWYILIMPPIILVAEAPNLKWIDDNAMMQLVPLIVVLLINIV